MAVHLVGPGQLPRSEGGKLNRVQDLRPRGPKYYLNLINN
ncbi:hypothetical protein [Hymenobacter coccineus]